MLRRGARGRRVGLNRGRFPSLWTCWHRSCVTLPSPEKMLMVVALHPYATLHTLPHQSHRSNESNTQIQTKPKRKKNKKSHQHCQEKASKEYEIKKEKQVYQFIPALMSEWIHRIKLEVQKDVCNYFRLKKKKLRNQKRALWRQKSRRNCWAQFCVVAFLSPRIDVL